MKADLQGHNKEERNAIRRDQIRRAAENCVISKGFHKASLALIASEAKMSVGQIYRYYQNKEEIIQDIVQELTNQHLARIRATLGVKDLSLALSQVWSFKDESSKREEALQLEIHAEASRNPKVREILRQADEELHQTSCQTLLADYPELSPEKAAAIVEFNACINEGRLFRALKSRSPESEGCQRLQQEANAKLLNPQGYKRPGHTLD